MRIFLHSLGLIFALALSAFAKQQQFRLEKPDAQSVALMCENNGWKAQAMKKQGDGAWSLTLSLAPGIYGYKFLVNGTDWIFDPTNPRRKTVDGVENSVLEISESEFGSTATSPSSTPMPTVDASPHAGEVLNFEEPLSQKRRVEAMKLKCDRLITVKIALATPPGFDPQKSWPILILSNTEDYPNVDSLGQFQQPANDAGWIVLAADPPSEEKSGDWREAVDAAALDALGERWPASKDWPIACGGMSGGAKNSAFAAAALAREHRRLIGMLMMGCNQDMASRAYRRDAPPNFLAVPVFLSSGKSDRIATPSHHEWVKNSLVATGFRKVRLESFDGAHEVHSPHVTEALNWFAAQTQPTTTPARASDFDRFFKKQ